MSLKLKNVVLEQSMNFTAEKVYELGKYQQGRGFTASSIM